MRPVSSASLEPTDPALREDVRRLGRLVGEMLTEQNGSAFFERIEAARTQAIARRRDAGQLDPLAVMGICTTSCQAAGRIRPTSHDATSSDTIAAAVAITRRCQGGRAGLTAP